MLKHLIFFTAFLFATQATDAEDQNTVFEPVSLTSSKLSLEKLIKFPKKHLKSKQDIAVVVRCDAFVKRNGKISSNLCYEEGKAHYPFITAINRAAKKATLKPGKVNGTSRLVYFQYYVFFIKKQGKTSIEVIGNSGLEVEKYGTNYSSPQRYRESSGNFGVGCEYNKKIEVKAIISKQGKAEKIDVIGNDLKDTCKKYLKKSFEEQEFIPAMVDGKAIRSYYSERIFDVMRHQ